MSSIVGIAYCAVMVVANLLLLYYLNYYLPFHMKSSNLQISTFLGSNLLASILALFCTMSSSDSIGKIIALIISIPVGGVLGIFYKINNKNKVHIIL